VARKALLAKEKEFTQQRDELSRQRRELSWAKVAKTYIFDGPSDNETLDDLFAGLKSMDDLSGLQSTRTIWPTRLLDSN
jgi:predicted dithiol-disulfide oxidoreductase (DUF899 family)